MIQVIYISTSFVEKISSILEQLYVASLVLEIKLLFNTINFCVLISVCRIIVPIAVQAVYPAITTGSSVAVALGWSTGLLSGGLSLICIS